MALALCLLSMGCAVHHDTASGRPEVVIPKASTPAIKSALANRMINVGFALMKDSEYQMSFDRNARGGQAVFFSTAFGGVPKQRITYSITQGEGGTRVVADLILIQNAGTGFERAIPLNDAPLSAEAQRFLQDVRATVGRKS